MASKTKKLKYSDLFTPRICAYYRKDIIGFVEDFIFQNDPEYELTPHQKEFLLSVQKNKRTSAKSGKGVGKAQPVDLVIDTPNGQTKFGDIRVGDSVFGSNGKPTEVIGVFPQGKKDVYRVVFDDESSTECCKEHLWAVKGRQDRRKNKDYQVRSLEEMMDIGIRVGKKLRFRQWEIPNNPEVSFDKQDVPINPYTLGVWLGDGCRGKAEISSVDHEVIDHLQECGEILKNQPYDKLQWHIDGLVPKLRKLNLLNKHSYEKSVPDIYKYNTAEIRYEILRGLLDTDGYTRKSGGVEFLSTSKKLTEDVAWLSRSLGFKVHKITRKKTWYNKNGETTTCRDAWRVGITPTEGSKLFYIERKQKVIDVKRQERYYKRNIDRVEYVGEKECVCIKVAAEDSLYLTNDFIPTHNTSGGSFAILWFLCMFDNPKIVCTAPSYPTLKSALWPEVAFWLKKSVFSEIFEYTSERLYLRESPENWWAEPRTAREKESMQGLHSKNMLLFVDEASGVKDDIIEALDTTITNPNNKLILVGNPTRVTGFFYDTFNQFKERWHTHTFNAEESPQVSPEQISYYKEKYGETHPLYLINVKGEFPEGNPDSYITLADVMGAVNRSVVPIGDVEIGCDVARYGDDYTVVYWRHGYKVYPSKKMEKSSVPEVVNLVLETVIEARHKSGYSGKIRIKVDDASMGGGVVDYLELDRTHNIEVVPCNFGGAGNDLYHNEATIMWSVVKDNIQYMELPNEPKLIEELSARRFNITDKGKTVIEPKSKYKKDFKESPDWADALVLCFAQKQKEKRVLKSFDKLDPNIIKDHFAYTGEDKFCSIYLSKDLTFNIVYVIWNGHNIYVYDEHIGTEAMAHIAYIVSGHGKFNRIIGNRAMFGKIGEDVASKFRRFKLNVYENTMYDELGAIEMLSVITENRRLQIQKDCTKLISQLTNWKMSGKKSEQDTDFGLCYALINVISFLKRKLENRAQIQYFKPYSDEKQDHIKSIGRSESTNSWMLN